MDQELADWDEAKRELFTQRTTLRRIYATRWEVIGIEHFLPMQNIYFCQPADAEQIAAKRNLGFLQQGEIVISNLVGKQL